MSQEIASQIRSIRAYRGMTQSDLARRAKISPVTLSQLEGQGKTVNLSTLEKICEVLDATLEVRIIQNEPSNP